MIFTLFQIKRNINFIIISVLLLLTNLYFNLNYDWLGFSLIVRAYLFVFAFYLIYNYVSEDSKKYHIYYKTRHKKIGSILFFFEARIIPFAFIYFLTIIFTFIDYLQQDGWPWNPILSLLNGRYSNIVIYSLILLFILKIKKRPSITIPIFISISVLYFIIDKYLYSIFPFGKPVAIIKVSKFFIIFFLIFLDYYRSKIKIIINFVFSIFASIIVYLIIVGFNYLCFVNSEKGSYVKKESGFVLAHLGVSVAIDYLAEDLYRVKDISKIVELYSYSKYYKKHINYTNEQWESLFFNGNLKLTEDISKYIYLEKVKIDNEKLIIYVHSRLDNNFLQVKDFRNIIKLSAFSLKGNEHLLYTKLKYSNRSFTIWSISVLGEIGNYDSIPVLLQMLVDIDYDVAKAAYKSLKKITGLDPVKVIGYKVNSISIYKTFKEFYLQKNNN